MSIKWWPSCIMLAPMNCTSWACGSLNACTAACCHFSPEIDTSNTHATLLVAALDIQQACAAYEMELIPASYKSWWPEPRSDLQLVYLTLTQIQIGYVGSFLEAACLSCETAYLRQHDALSSIAIKQQAFKVLLQWQNWPRAAALGGSRYNRWKA